MRRMRRAGWAPAVWGRPPARCGGPSCGRPRADEVHGSGAETALTRPGCSQLVQKANRGSATEVAMRARRGAAAGLVLLALSAGRQHAGPPAPVADEAGAVAALEELGARVRRNDKRPGNPVVAVNLARTKVTDADL